MQCTAPHCTAPSKNCTASAARAADCNGHATPYHAHGDLVCEYNQTAAGHSTLVGFALDGRGMYGRYESTRTLPVLDACNGHWGPVPAYKDKGEARNPHPHPHPHAEPGAWP